MPAVLERRRLLRLRIDERPAAEPAARPFEVLARRPISASRLAARGEPRPLRIEPLLAQQLLLALSTAPGHGPFIHRGRPACQGGARAGGSSSGAAACAACPAARA